VSTINQNSGTHQPEQDDKHQPGEHTSTEDEYTGVPEILSTTAEI
jgi:hypothetical protein